MSLLTSLTADKDLWSPENLYLDDQITPFHKTSLGHLYEGDCLEILPCIASGTVDTIFADPPFNIGKSYGPKVDDDRPDDVYLTWCRSWVEQCARILKPGGSIFIYNIPKWNIPIGQMLSEFGLDFRHWIAVNIKTGFPIKNQLYPAHYSLLYYTKGIPNTFKTIKTPVEVCRHCEGELKDYGGHRDKIHAMGVSLTDVWSDISPVRHKKYKSDKRGANQLSTKLVRRTLELTTEEGDLVLDPFGGSGTTFDVCELLGRHWIGIEIDFADVIVDRLENGVMHHPYDDFVTG